MTLQKILFMNGRTHPEIAQVGGEREKVVGVNGDVCLQRFGTTAMG
jgi:hypothetical protein